MFFVIFISIESQVQASENKISSNNKIFNNEIYNYTDGIQLNYDANGKIKSGYVEGTLIENKFIYITPDLYQQENGNTYACAENGIDIKVGSTDDSEKTRTVIKNNVITGFRETFKSCGGSGSPGDAIVLHRRAKNILIENNIITNSAGGIKLKTFHPNRLEERVENIEVSNNLIADIRKFSSKATGTALLLGAGVNAHNNTIVRVDLPIKIIANQAENDIKENLFADLETVNAFEKNTQSNTEKNLWYTKPEQETYSHGEQDDLVKDSGNQTIRYKTYTFNAHWTQRTFAVEIPNIRNQLVNQNQFQKPEHK